MKVLRLPHVFKKRRHIRDYFRITQAGTITGAADNDPSGIATYTQIGALTRFSQLWLMIFTIPMLIEVEEMSARVGVVVKKGLAQVIKEHYGVVLALFASTILLICNVATIGADLAGMAAALELLTGISWLVFITPITLFISYFLLTKNYHYVSRFLFIMTPFLLLYVVSSALVKPPWLEIVKETFIPVVKFEASYLMAAVALLGTTISPYLIFWQTTEEIEEKKSISHLKEENAGVISGMVYANLIFYFIVLCAGATIYGKIPAEGIKTAADAALTLKPVAGDLAWLLFSIALLFSGLIAIPVLTASSAYALAEVFGWKEGFDKTFTQARSFHLVMMAALFVGATFVLVGLSPIQMLYYSQVLQGILTPALIIFLLKVCNDKRIMGEYTNSRWDNFIGWLTALIMIFFTVAMFVQLLY